MTSITRREAAVKRLAGTDPRWLLDRQARVIGLQRELNGRLICRPLRRARAVNLIPLPRYVEPLRGYPGRSVLRPR